MHIFHVINILRSKLHSPPFTKDKNRILFVLHLPPPVHGSAVVGKYIYDSKLIKNGFNCRYINLNTSEDLSSMGKIGFRKLIKILSIGYQIFKQIITFRPSLYYMAPTLTGFGFYKDIIYILILKFTGKRIIFHLHNKGVVTRQHLLFNHLLYKITFHNSYCILLSSLLYADIKKYVPKSRVRYCPNGVPDVQSRKSSPRKENDICRIAFLSNMMRDKGVYTLLKACKILSNRGLIYNTIFVGPWKDINENDFNKFVIFNNLQGNVFYEGTKYGKEKSEFLENVDFFVFPTYYKYECFSLVIIEAMQYGLPVISTNEGGILDIVENGKTGFIVNKNDATDLANKMTILIENKILRYRMGKAAEKKFKRKFTFSIWERNMFNILHEIVNM